MQKTAAQEAYSAWIEKNAKGKILQGLAEHFPKTRRNWNMFKQVPAQKMMEYITKGLAREGAQISGKTNDEVLAILRAGLGPSHVIPGGGKGLTAPAGILQSVK